MNVSELARQVSLSTKELRQVLPELGFDIGGRAIKVDNKVAQEVIKKLSNKANREKIMQALSAEQQTENQEEKLTPETEKKANSKEISIPHSIIVKDLAQQMNMDVTKLVVELMKQGVMASLNDRIDYETASIVVEDFGFAPKQVIMESTDSSQTENIHDVIGKTEVSNARPPVIVVMGHVDHGKTLLLDSIRKTNVVDQESGGITQHIGAYQVEVDVKGSQEKQKLTFIDTPGHEAFSLMRSRGARVADLAILVVAADDGVQPQTIEAVSHIRKAELPFVVAINKIDKDTANPDNVKSGLAEIGITPEDWGGETMMIPISAKKGTNLQDLLDSLLLLYEVEKNEIIADPDGVVVGSIIESHVNKGSGPVATVLVLNGTLRQGDTVMVSDIPGKIRSMTDWQGNVIKESLPSTPVAVLGLKSAPRVGDILKGVDASEVKKTSRQHKKKAAAAAIKDKIISESEGEQFNLVIKADVLGSLEALQESLIKLNHQGISVNIVNQGLGYITEADVLTAEASDAYLLGFSAFATAEAEELARSKNVVIKSFEIIYDLLDFVAEEAAKKLSPEVNRKELGRFKILKVFREEKGFTIAGGKVLTGELLNKTKVDHYRGKQKIGQGMIDELQSGKEEVKQVVEDQEAGMKLTGLGEIHPGDELVNFIEEEVKKKIEL